MEQAIEKKPIDKLWLAGALLILSTCLLAYKNLAFYIHPDFNLLFTLLMTPFILFIPEKGKLSQRFGWLSLVMLLLYPVLKIQSCFFFGFCFLLLFIVENFWGKLNNGALFLVALCSPMATYVIKIFGFPIRLWLSEIAVKLFKATGLIASAEGNQIFMNGEAFLVEPACVGLKMVTTALLLCLAIVSYRERRYQRQLKFPAYVLILLSTLGLIILANLFRIIGLIIFKSPEGTVSHEIIGVVCTGVYSVLPLLGISLLIFSRFKKWTIPFNVAQKNEEESVDENINGKGINAKPSRLSKIKKYTKFLPYLLLAIQLGILGYFNVADQYYVHKSYTTSDELFQLDGYTSSEVEFNGTKLENENALVYRKPCFNFWSADHNPAICWKGSGYNFTAENVITVKEHKIYTAELVNNEDKIYTAWWFSNGETITTNQLKWRWDMMTKKKSFHLINVSCETPEMLEMEIACLMDMT